MASPERRRVVESAYAAMPGLKRRARCLAPIGCLHCRCYKGGGLRQAASCLRLRQGASHEAASQRKGGPEGPRGARLQGKSGRARLRRRAADGGRPPDGLQAARPRPPRRGGGRPLAQEWRYGRAREGEEEGSRPHLLHRPLQLGPPAQRVRGPPAHVAHRRRQQPIGTQQLAWRPPNERHE